MRKERPEFKFQAEKISRVSHEEDSETLWRDARVLTSQLCDVYSPVIDALTPVKSKHVPTMGVDKYLRVYFNEEYLYNLKALAEAVSSTNPCEACGATKHHPLAYIAGIIYHESQHPLRKHHARAEAKDIQRHNNRKWNIACDCEINDEALELFKQLFEYHNENVNRPAYQAICFPPGLQYPSNYGLEDHLLAENYFLMLDGDGGSGERGEGSGVSNIREEWELGPPDSECPGVEAADMVYITKEVAKNIQNAKNRGCKSINRLLDWADQQIPPSKYNWKKEFDSLVRNTLSKVHGYKKRSYANLHKKSAAQNYAVVFPRKYSVKTNVLVITDCSGSMFCGDRYIRALAEIQNILKSVRGTASFVCGDWDAGELQTVKSLSDIKFTGGGGTSMKRVVSDAMVAALDKLKNKPDLVILHTDGETDWPDKSDLFNIPMIACIVNENKNSCYGDPIPSWIKSIWIPTNE